MFGLTKSELAIFKPLTTPIKIQNWLDKFPINWEKRGDTYMSPRRALRAGKMHCLEGALCAAVALWLHDEPPLVLDLKAAGDDDHVVTLYKRHHRWGAISKTNHATLRWRDPVYKTVRELAVSYFHEYFVNQTGAKVLRSFSRPVNLARFGAGWITAEENLDYIAEAIDEAPHQLIFPSPLARYLRPADTMEKKAGRLIEWKRSNWRT
ncbi:MAG: hypothetical protein HYV42_05665 [Candidatus Magasanikbacteria bacterium]|nr:hypothetical protein [Candidatus Magasanikbacteria bacterium]